MLLKSINQINSIVANNPTIAKYFEYSKAYNESKLPSIFYRNNHSRIIGTYLYWSAWKELIYRNCIPSNIDQWTKTIYIKTDIDGIDISLKGSIDLKGVTLTVDTYNQLPFIDNTYQIRSNRSFSKESILEFFKKTLLPQHLYAHGEWREFQLDKKLSKEQLKSIYKEDISQSKQRSSNDPQSYFNAIKRHLRKRKNIIVSEYFWCYDDIKKLLKSSKRAITTYVEPAPDLRDIASECDGDIDQLESYFWSQFKKNTIYI